MMLLAAPEESLPIKMSGRIKFLQQPWFFRAVAPSKTSAGSGKCTETNEAEGKCYGGFARIKTAVVEETRLAAEENIPLLYLNAGDSYQGTILFTLFKWPIVKEFVEKLGFDVMSLGNHEFDNGVKGLAPFLENSTIPVVACNLNVENEPLLKNSHIKPSVIVERGGLQIGIIGYLTSSAKSLSKIGNNVKVLDEVTAITEEVKKLKAQGVQTIIALGHSGYDIDQVIARDVPDVDIVVGAHSHSFLYTGNPPDSDKPVGPYPTFVKNPSGRMVPIVQAYAFTKYLGKLDINLDDEGHVINASGNPILLNNRYTQDPEMLTALSVWVNKSKEIGAEYITTTKVVLSMNCRVQECNLGNLMADALVHHAMNHSSLNEWSDSAISIYSGGGIRAPIAPSDGIIQFEDVLLTSPFYNNAVLVSMKGWVLLEALEWSVARYDPVGVPRGEFLQVSGIHVVYDLRQEVGSRVVSVTVQCSKCPFPEYHPLEKSQTYNVTTTSFLYYGGDQFDMITKHGTLIKDYEITDTEIFRNYLKRNFPDGITMGTEERIKFVSGLASSAKRIGVSSTVLVLVLSIFKSLLENC